ncbi:hypothetical protein GW17_00053958 [Ensete ventricosum]|nr:hypothetical protein GW17_00053958 [Ensete ventricosum]
MGDCGSTSLGESQSGYHLRMQSPVPGSERSGTARRCCQNQSLNQIWSLKTTVVAKVDEKQLPQTRTLLTTGGDLLFNNVRRFTFFVLGVDRHLAIVENLILVGPLPFGRRETEGLRFL